MRPRHREIVGQFFRLLATGQPTRSLPDGQLLDRFLGTGDGEAFAVLVERHGPLVLRVCGGVLAVAQDVEDAFQATFLVLVRKAHTVRKEQSLGSWLYKVAHRIALRARARAFHRATGGIAMNVSPPADPLVLPDPADEVTWSELRSVLDEELRRLPDRYQFPLFLCYAEGKTRDEAAEQLGWSLGTFRRRLERGRELLRSRLAGRGLSLPAALFGSVLASSAAQAVPRTLVWSAVAAAQQWAADAPAAGLLSTGVFALAEEGIKTMSHTRLLALAFLLLTVGAIGTTVAALPTLAEEPAAPQPRAAAAADPAARAEPPPALDLYGDPLPRGAIARIGTARLRPLGVCLAMAYARDGKIVAYGGFNGLQLFDVATGRLVRIFPNASWVRAISFSPDGTMLAAGGDDQSIRFWDVATAKLLHRFAGDQGSISSVAFSPDGKTLASGGSTYSGRPTGLTLRLWDVATTKLVHDFQGHRERITSVAFSPDGKSLATGPNGDHPAHYLWDVATGKQVRKWDGPSQSSVAFTPDGKMLVAGGLSGLRAWDVTTGKAVSDFGGFNSSVDSVAVAPDGKRLLTGGNGDAVRLWDLAALKQVRQLSHAPDYTHVAFAPDGKTLAWCGNCDQTLYLWDVAAGKELHDFKGHRQAVSFMGFTDGGKGLVTTAGVWEAATGRHLKPLPSGVGAPAENFALSPDGAVLAAGEREGIRLWDLATGKEVRQLAGDASLLLFSPRGQTLVGVAVKVEMLNNGEFRSTAMLRRWDVKTGKELQAHELPGDQARSACVALSADGKFFASGSGTKQVNQVRLWNTETGRLLRQFAGPGDLYGLAFSPDGKVLATAGAKQFCLWEVATGKELHQLPGDKWTAVAFAPDGKTLATGSQGGLVQVWDVLTGKELQTLSGHRQWVCALRFSPDGRQLASGSQDTTALVWDAQRWQPAQPSVPAELSAKELDELWSALAETGMRTYPAFSSLVHAPEQAVPFLQRRLRPPAPADADRVARWIRDLDSNEFDVREKAARDLERLGELAGPALRKALDGKPTLEVRQRLEGMLAKVDAQIPTGESLRGLRAVWVLEWIGTPAARQLLQKLAAGTTASWQTEEARAALERLANSPAGKP